MLPADALSPWLIRPVAFVFGALWGSFFNVAIHRWPREMSVVVPPSHCPACHARIPPHHNLPILGYLLLRGRAACCGAKLSARYPLVELLGALLCLVLAERFWVDAPAGTTLATAALDTLVFFAFSGGLLVATFVDLEWMEIPDEVSLPGAALGLATATLRSWPSPEAVVLGAGGGFLVVHLVFVWGYERLTGRRGMGEGDPKLLMMIGAFLGWEGVMFAVFAGAFQGLLAAGTMLLTGRHPAPAAGRYDAAQADVGVESEAADASKATSSSPKVDDSVPDYAPVEAPPRHRGHLKVPFGPFLALGALEYLFFGGALMQAYWSFLGGGGQ